MRLRGLAGGAGHAEIELFTTQLQQFFLQGWEVVRLATLAGRFAELLSGAVGARSGDLADLARKAAAVDSDWPRQQRVHELKKMILQMQDLGVEGVRTRQQSPEP